MMATRIMQGIKRQVAESEARGQVAAISALVRDGLLPASTARAQLRALAKAKRIPAAMVREALARLG